MDEDVPTLKPATIAVKAGRPAHEPDDPLNEPITMASTYVAGGEREYGRYANPTWQAAFAYTAVWFLLFGGVRPVFELQGARRRGTQPSSDADQLAHITPVPAGLWVAFFLLVCVGALVGAAVVLGVLTATSSTGAA